VAEIVPLFARCLWTEWVDPIRFNKQHIIQTIKSNYSKQRKRNVWGTQSSLHHEYSDKNNPDFESVDYTSMIDCYTELFENFFNDIGIKCRFKFMIDNYTVTNEDQHMQKHNHIGWGDDYIDFSCVHYLECDSEVHAPITFENDDPHQKFLNYTPALKKIEERSLFNSYFNARIDYQIKEDYITIFPADLTHSVMKKSDEVTTTKDRICIVTNIQVLED